MPLPTLSEEDVIWLAGLFEGEGSFFINDTPSKRRNRTPESAPFSVVFVLSMNDLDVVTKAGELLGVNVKLLNRRTSAGNRTYRIISEKR